MDDVDEVRVPGIQPHELRHVLEQRLGRVHACDAAQQPHAALQQVLARVARDVRGQRVPDDVEVGRRGPELGLEDEKGCVIPCRYFSAGRIRNSESVEFSTKTVQKSKTKAANLRPVKTYQT